MALPLKLLFLVLLPPLAWPPFPPHRSRTASSQAPKPMCMSPQDFTVGDKAAVLLLPGDFPTLAK